MEDDDDMIMIIVGDEENQPFAMPIKQEPTDAEELDESILDLDSILEKAEMYGEYISLIDDEYHDCEYLEVDLDNKKLTRKPRVPKPKLEIKIEEVQIKHEIQDASQSDSDTEDYSNTPKQSYIAQLRKNFPKMRKDEEFIVAHLAEIMKHTKPPPPPNGFYDSVDGMFVCVFCYAESPSLSSASRHFQKKHGTRYLVCYACGLNYRCTTGLYKHEKRCSAPDARIVLKARGRYLGRKGRCRPYLTLNTFDPWDRKNKRNEKKRLFCSQCTASFSHKEALMSHEFMHRGERPYQCDQCPFAYTSAIALRRHQQRHLGLEYICDACGRSFKAKTTLIVHMNTHLPQRKFPCDRCERRFAQKSALRHHIDRDHLHIPPPFACAACPKRFPRVSNLKAHMKSKHGMTLMTREMFIKALPTMKESELKQATVVFNSFESGVITAPLGESIFNQKGEPRSIEDDISVSSEDSDKYIVSEPEDGKYKPSIKQFDVVTEIEEIDDNNAESEETHKRDENLVSDNRVAQRLQVENYEQLAKSIASKGESSITSNLEISKSNTQKDKSAIHVPFLETIIKTEPKNIILDNNEIEIKPKMDEYVPTGNGILSKSVQERQMEIKKVLNEGPTKSRINLMRRGPMQTRSTVMKTRSGMLVKSLAEYRDKIIKKCL